MVCCGCGWFVCCYVFDFREWLVIMRSVSLGLPLLVWCIAWRFGRLFAFVRLVVSLVWLWLCCLVVPVLSGFWFVVAIVGYLVYD